VGPLQSDSKGKMTTRFGHDAKEKTKRQKQVQKHKVVCQHFSQQQGSLQQAIYLKLRIQIWSFQSHGNSESLGCLV